jgi:hypothetical protein
MKRAVYILMTALIVSAAPWALGENGDGLLVLQQKLSAQFTLTKTTAAKDDIVTAGSVLVLHEDGLLMYSTAASTPPVNTYKDGKIVHGIDISKISKICQWTYCPPMPPTPDNRTFVVGEKFWITGLDVQPDSVIFSLYSDPYQDTHYYGRLKFQFPKGRPLSADDELKTIAKVLSVDPGENVARPPVPDPEPHPTQQDRKAEPPPPIPAPTPPSDARPTATKTIALGQTKDEVIGNFGPPQKVVKLPNKEWDYYPDMKVTFVNGKVSGVDELPMQAASGTPKQ